MWIPIYIVFLGIILGGPFIGLMVALILAYVAMIEYLRQVRANTAIPWAVPGYVILFGVCLLGMIVLFFTLPNDQYAVIIALTCFGSVLSDVCAFFLGNYLRGHKLPRWINPGKSWEGVAGQLLGGVIGVWIAALILDVNVVWWLGFVIGIASAIGDLINSIAKRQLAIKDWGSSIPGHGGVLDRCSSLAVAMFAVAIITYFTDVIVVS